MVWSLTPALRDFAVAIDEMTEALGRPPTYQEIAGEMGYSSKSQVHGFAKGLFERGWLKAPVRGKRVLVLLKVPPASPEPEIEVTGDGRLALLAAHAAGSPS